MPDVCDRCFGVSQCRHALGSVLKPLALTLFALISLAAGEALLLDHHPGRDWRLHPDATMAPDAGYLTWDHDWAVARARAGHGQDGPLRHATILMPTWAELEPTPEVYDWDRLDRAIAQVSAAPGCGFLLAPVGFAVSYPYWDRKRPQRDGIPDWVREGDGGLTHLRVGTVAWWRHPDEQRLFARFLAALGERYQNHPRLLGVMIGFLDPYHGEAVWRGGQAALSEAESDFELSPEVLLAWGKRWIDDWVAAFPQRVDRLAWPGSSRFDFWAPGPRMIAYRDVMEELWTYAYARGCGGRDGGVESWNRYVDGGTGQTWTAAGHLEIDPDFAPIAEGRLWYTENEVWTALDEAPAQWRHLIPGAWYASCMRTLQMHRSWMAVGPRWFDRLEAIDPPFLRWVEIGLGQRVETTTDAWVWLREGYRPSEAGPARALVNIERWLTQRDHPGAISQPAARVELGPAASHWTVAADHEFHARLPAAGSDRLLFHLDDRLPPSFTANGVTLLVTYYGQPQTSFSIAYDGGNSAEIAAEGTGLHTVVVRLPGFRNRNALAHGADLALIAGDSGMPPVSMVRIIAGSE